MRRVMCGFLLFIFLLACGVVQAAGVQFERISRQDRYETAV